MAPSSSRSGEDDKLNQACRSWPSRWITHSRSSRYAVSPDEARTPALEHPAPSRPSLRSAARPKPADAYLRAVGHKVCCRPAPAPRPGKPHGYGRVQHQRYRRAQGLGPIGRRPQRRLTPIATTQERAVRASLCKPVRRVRQRTAQALLCVAGVHHWPACPAHPRVRITRIQYRTRSTELGAAGPERLQLFDREMACGRSGP